MNTKVAIGILVALFASEARGSDETTTDLRTVVGYPQAHDRVSFDVDLLFRGTGDIYNIFYTVFEPGGYLNFSAWGSGDAVWTPEGYRAPHHLFYVSRDNYRLMNQVVALRPQTWIRARCIVRSTFGDRAWIEVLSMKTEGKQVKKETLRRMVRGWALWQRGEPQRALLEMESIRTTDFPDSFAARFAIDHSRAALAAGDLSGALVALRRARALDPEVPQYLALATQVRSAIEEHRASVASAGPIGTETDPAGRREAPVEDFPFPETEGKGGETDATESSESGDETDEWADHDWDAELHEGPGSDAAEGDWPETDGSDEWTDEVTDATDDEWTDETTDAADDEWTDEVTDATDDEWTDETTDAADDEWTDETTDAADSEWTDEATDAVDSEWTDEATDAVDSEWTDETTDAADDEWTDETTDATDDEWTDETTDAVDSEWTDETTDAVDDEWTDEATDATDSEWTDEATDATDDEWTDEATESVEGSSGESGAEVEIPEVSIDASELEEWTEEDWADESRQPVRDENGAEGETSSETESTTDPVSTTESGTEAEAEVDEASDETEAAESGAEEAGIEVPPEVPLDWPPAGSDDEAVEESEAGSGEDEGSEEESGSGSEEESGSGSEEESGSESESDEKTESEGSGSDA